MDSRIQFRIDDETKQLVQQMALSQGRTLSEACRELTEQLAAQQRQVQDHWLKVQVDAAFEKLDSGNAVFIEQKEAVSSMEARKAKIRNR